MSNQNNMPAELNAIHLQMVVAAPINVSGYVRDLRHGSLVADRLDMLEAYMPVLVQGFRKKCDDLWCNCVAGMLGGTGTIRPERESVYLSTVVSSQMTA